MLNGKLELALQQSPEIQRSDKKRLVGALDNSEIQNLKDRVRGIDCVPRIANSMFSRV